MGIVKRIFGLGKQLQDIKQDALIEEFDRKSFAFISLNNGSGSKTVATDVALTLSKKYRVCIVDLDFISPGVGSMLNTIIKPERSILQYFMSSEEVPEILTQVKGEKGLWVMGTSPIDDPLHMADIEEDMFRSLLEYITEAFDYIIYSMSYNPFAEWFIYGLDYVDRGFIVWDEQIDNTIKTKVMLDYIHKMSAKANSINNIIINKRTELAFPYEKIDEINCSLYAEVPYVRDVSIARNEGRFYIRQGGVSEDYLRGIQEVIDVIEQGQQMTEG